MLTDLIRNYNLILLKLLFGLYIEVCLKDYRSGSGTNNYKRIEKSSVEKKDWAFTFLEK
jgi:hypothetical protein